MELRKNVLWINSLQIEEVRGNHKSLADKNAHLKRLLRCRENYWNSI